MGAAVPWIIKGGIALGSAFLGKKRTSSAMQRSPEEMRALNGAYSALEGSNSDGDAASKMGLPMLAQAGDYYSRLLNGDRGQMSAATAAPRAEITDIYRGAASNLERSPIRGGERTLAMSTLNREKASKLAQLTTGVQPNAAAGLAQVGSTGAGLGAYGKAASAGAYANLLRQGADNRSQAEDKGSAFAKNMGGILTDMFMGGGGGKAPTIKSRPIGTGMGTGPVAIPGGTQFTL